MVVADYEVYAMLAGMGNFLVGLDAAIEDDDEFHPLIGKIVDNIARNPIPLLITCGYEIVDVGVEVAEIFVDERHCRGAVHVIVTVDHDFLFRPHSPVEPGYRLVHVGHQKRVVEVFQPGVKEPFGLLHRCHASLNQQLAYRRTRRIALRQRRLYLLLFLCQG